MLYTVAKQVGAMHIALHGQTDAVILTGGIAFNDYCIQGLREWLEGLAPIVVIPGEDEMGALAMNALGVLRGELTLQEYMPDGNFSCDYIEYKNRDTFLTKISR